MAVRAGDHAHGPRIMTAPTIAVIQVDTLKNVLREWTWKIIFGEPAPE
jgi:hypothetical protein